MKWPYQQWSTAHLSLRPALKPKTSIVLTYNQQDTRLLVYILPFLMCLKCYVQHVLCLLFLVSNNLNVFLFHFSPSLSQSLFSKCLWIPISYIFISVEPDLPGWILGTNASGDLQGIKKESTVVKQGGKAGIWWTENQWQQNCKHWWNMRKLGFFIFYFYFLF